MTAIRDSLSPAAAASSLTLAAEVFGLWNKGSVVILDQNGITVDGKRWEMGRKHIPAPNSAITANECVFRFEDEMCKIVFEGKELCMHALVGLRYIHYLIQHIWEDVHASTLVAMFNGEASVCAGEETKEALLKKTLVIREDRGEKMLTPSQRRVVAKRLEELREELGDLQQNDQSTDEVEEQIKKCETYLKKVGFGSRAAKFSNQSERDRKSVAKAIKFAIKCVGEQNPTLGLFLSKSFKRGIHLFYKPVRPINWQT